jgi:hypothetical protein
MRRAKPKTAEVTARQMLNWICKTIPRIIYNSGDGSVSIYAGKGHAHAETSQPAAVMEALALARRRDIRERASIRRDKREHVWPYDRDHWDREWAA